MIYEYKKDELMQTTCTVRTCELTAENTGTQAKRGSPMIFIILIHHHYDTESEIKYINTSMEEREL